MSFDLPQSGLLALPREAVTTLRAVLFRQDAGTAASHLYEAGFAGGNALHTAFVRWCADRKLPVPENMNAPDFERHVTGFFSELGLGTVAVASQHDVALTFDSANWAEADPASGLQFPGCYLTMGLFTGFFAALGGAPVSVMEVECRSMGSERCRFLVASAETIQQVYDGMSQGTTYQAVLEQAG